MDPKSVHPGLEILECLYILHGGDSVHTSVQAGVGGDTYGQARATCSAPSLSFYSPLSFFAPHRTPPITQSVHTNVKPSRVENFLMWHLWRSTLLSCHATCRLSWCCRVCAWSIITYIIVKNLGVDTNICFKSDGSLELPLMAKWDPGVPSIFSCFGRFQAKSAWMGEATWEPQRQS